MVGIETGYHQEINDLQSLFHRLHKYQSTITATITTPSHRFDSKVNLISSTIDIKNTFSTKSRSQIDNIPLSSTTIATKTTQLQIINETLKDECNIKYGKRSYISTGSYCIHYMILYDIIYISVYDII